MAFPKKQSGSNCEQCEFYIYDEDWGTYLCDRRLDEDERADYLAGYTRTCPYFRFYDEYKSVQKQN